MNNRAQKLDIIAYSKSYEKEWVELRARVVARSHSWDFVERKKVCYDNQTIELLLLRDSTLIGYVDVELEVEPGEVCWNSESVGAVVQEFGVDPKLQNKGYGKLLLKEIRSELLEKNIDRLELWTKDPKSALIYAHFGLKQIFIHKHYRKFIQDDPALEKLFSGKVLTSYGYFINEDLGLDEGFEAPLGPHLGIGFEWSFNKSDFLK